MKKGYSQHSLNQNSKKKFFTDWSKKEGVFETPQGKWICRISEPMQNTSLLNYTTISQHDTEEEAQKAYDEFQKK